jgi:hypothetical protein
MKSIDEMRAELEAAGWSFQHEHDEYNMQYTGIAINHDESTRFYTDWYSTRAVANEKACELAYAHLQREKQFQAMREFLGEMAATDFTGTDMRLKGAELWREKAKRLLATLPDSD